LQWFDESIRLAAIGGSQTLAKRVRSGFTVVAKRQDSARNLTNSDWLTLGGPLSKT
jgi:hypothetical protein